MKQKKFYLTLAASMMLAVTGFTSCTIEDNSVIPDQGGEDEPEIIVPEEDPFDEGNLVKNGNASKDDVANFLSHDFLDPDGEKAVNPGPGPARIIVDPTDKTNRCFVVGTNNNVTNAWDSQFFITIGEDQIINEKDKFTLKFKYRADKAQSGVGIQTHTNPGGYHGNLPGQFSINFTEEWQEFDSGEVEVVASPGWPPTQAKAGFYTFAFNLSDKTLGGNTIYFDDIRVEVNRYDPFDDGNLVKNGKLEKDDVSNFLSHDFLTPDGEKAVNPGPGPARIIVDPTDENNHCIIVGTNNNAAQAWDSQFFITVGEDNMFKTGDKVTLKFRYRADKAQDGVAIQSHTNPGGYHGNLPNDFSINFTTEWQQFNVQVPVVASPSGWPPTQAKTDFYTFAFNLAVKGAADGGNNIYFDDIQVLVEKPTIEWEDFAVLENLNGDFEGTDVSGIVWKFKENGADAFKQQIQEGVGKDGTRGTIADSFADAAQDWDSQFFIILPKIYAENTKYRVTFDAKADVAATIDLQQHQEADGNHYINNCGSKNITTEWATYTFDGQAASSNGNNLMSFAFNLNKTVGEGENAVRINNRFYFDNIKIEIAEIK